MATGFQKDRAKNLGNFAKKGNVPWNKKKWWTDVCRVCSKEFLNGKGGITKKSCSVECANKVMNRDLKGKSFTKEHLNNLLIARRRDVDRKPRLGMKNSLLMREKSSLSHRGKKFTIKHRENLRKSHIGLLTGEKHPMWKGGITPINASIRNSSKYKAWRKQVFERDKWSCQGCGKHGGEINADHIKQFAYYPELRFEVSNGRTLCVRCHKKTDTYGGRHGRLI